jgi:hypothetical protein
VPHRIPGIKKYDRPCVFILTSLGCLESYIGYEERIRNVKYNKEDSGFAMHIIRWTHRSSKTEVAE